MNPEAAAIIADLDALYPGVYPLTIDEVMTYTRACRQVVTTFMKRHGKKLGRWRIPRVVFAKWWLDPKRK